MYDGEKLNAWTHLVGAVLALVGAVVLVVLAALDGDAWKLVSVSIYGVTLYHSFRGRAKDILRKLDHQSIYLLIAGSYTPFCLVTLRGPWGWSLLGTVWGLAVLGGLQEMRPRNDARIVSLVIYIVMGWGAVITLPVLVTSLDVAQLVLLGLGGVLYTVGAVILGRKRPDPSPTRFGYHEVWHSMTIAAGGCHFALVATLL